MLPVRRHLLCLAMLALLAPVAAPAPATADDTACAAAPGGTIALDDPFDHCPLTPTERAYLQQALAVAGHYTGRVDGDWGAGSARAMAAFVGALGDGAAQQRHIARLVDRYERWVRDEGWERRTLANDGHSAIVPARAMRDTSPSRTQALWEHPSGDLTVQSSLMRESMLNAYVGSLRSTAREVMYDRDTADWLVLTVRQAGDREIYVRADRKADAWAVTEVAAGPAMRRQLGAIATSIWLSIPTAPALPDDGVVRALVERSKGGPVVTWQGGPRARIVVPGDGSADPAGRTVPERPAPDDGTGGAASSMPGGSGPARPLVGTGFRVTPDGHVLTHGSLARECAAIYVGETPARMFMLDDTMEIALLLPDGARRGAPVAPLALDSGAGGETVALAGFAPGGTDDAPRAVDTEMGAREGERGQRALERAVPEGYAGAPLLDAAGRVVGLAAPDPRKLADASGSAAAGVNYAIDAEAIRSFLLDGRLEHGIALPGAPADDAAPAARAAPYTVRVRCE
ncbi:MAG: serine protease [Pseudomonadota bacterium]